MTNNKGHELLVIVRSYKLVLLLSLSVVIPALSLEEDSPKGDGPRLRYFLGDEEDGDKGTHLRRLGDVGLMSGSKSMVLFRVAPHAMALLVNGRQTTTEIAVIAKVTVNEII